MKKYILHQMKMARAFTLIELLVVIAIMSMLFSILLPALSHAKELAKGVKCMSNQRACGMAMQYYATDNDGFMPSSEDWVNELVSIMGDAQPNNAFSSNRDTMPQALFCPCDENPYPKPYMTGEMEVTSYFVNGASTDFAMGGGRHVGVGLFGGKCRIDDVERPAQCMMLGETSNYGKVVDADHPAIQEAFAAAGASLSDARRRFHHRATSGFYHDSKMSIHYVDGHSEMFRGNHVDPLNLSEWPGGPMMDPTTSFYPDLSLPTAAEDPHFWGPTYTEWERSNRDN